MKELQNVLVKEIKNILVQKNFEIHGYKGSSDGSWEICIMEKCMNCKTIFTIIDFIFKYDFPQTF